jgi:chemotaxis protein methyltransferase CheR
VPRPYDEVRLEADEFRLLRDLFNEHAGLWFGPEQRSVLERRLRERLVVHGLSSFGEYYELLRFRERGSSELSEALDLVTVNETYFFREDYQLRAFKNEVLPMLLSSARPHDKRLSIWSAGCATGEEVYTLAICALEADLPPDCDVRIFGSDISRRCVASARRGVYGQSSFRATTPDARRRWFRDEQGGATVDDRVRSLCHFGHVNLLDPARTVVVGRVDAIFCRNVLIYFDDASRRRVIDMFYERLHPGGFLMLGHSESLLNVSTAFELVHLKEDLVYKKPAGAKVAQEEERTSAMELKQAVQDLDRVIQFGARTRRSP